MSFKRDAVSKTAKSGNIVPFRPTKEKPIVVGVLVDVKVTEYEEKEDNEPTGETFPVLEFIFKDKKGKRTHVHKEWMVLEGFASSSGKEFSKEECLAWQDDRLTHIFNSIAKNDGAAGKLNDDKGLGFTEEEFDTEIDSWRGFFAQVVKDFKTYRDGKPLYTTEKGNPIYLWMKLIYDRKDNVNFPKYGNFLEVVIKGEETILYHKVGGKNPERHWPKEIKNNGNSIPMPTTNNEITSNDDLPGGFFPS